MTEQTVVGLKPRLPRRLQQSPWWTEPVRAERLAALRIAVAAVLLVDVLGTYLPNAADFFGSGSLGGPEVFPVEGASAFWSWSLFRGVEDGRVLQAGLILWAVAAGFLLIGLLARLSAAATWMLSLSFMNINFYIQNAGDAIRTILLFYLILSPCGAAWSVDRWRAARRKPAGAGAGAGPVYVHPWALRLLFLQMAAIYFFNGVHKLASPHWLRGDVLYYVMANPVWAHWSYAQVPIPYLLTRLMTWTVLVWELGFPFWVLWPRTRRPALALGVLFHLGLAISLELGMFPYYMLCLYVPLLPWEKAVRNQESGIRNQESALIDS